MEQGGLPLYSEPSGIGGVADSVPLFVRIGEKGSATFYARIYEALLCPAECPFAFSTRSKRTHIANAGSGPGSLLPVKPLVFAAMRCRDGLANAFCSKVPQSADSP